MATHIATLHKAKTGFQQFWYSGRVRMMHSIVTCRKLMGNEESYCPLNGRGVRGSRSVKSRPKRRVDCERGMGHSVSRVD